VNPVVTGIGFITPIGNDRAGTERSLREGRHGFENIQFLGNPDLPVRVAGTVKGFSVDSPNWRDWSWPSQFSVSKETLRGLAPHGLYAVCAVNGARGNPMGVVSSISGTLNFNLAARYRITGTVCGFVSACASSSHALGYAIDDIRLGRLKRAIVVGAEEMNADSLLPFAHMRALSRQSDPALASRPFDIGRDGFVGAGGATVLIIESPESARARGARAMAVAAGWGQAADGYSVAAPHPEGSGLLLAMRRALADAKVSPGACLAPWA